jgi:hypothetical protein
MYNHGFPLDNWGLVTDGGRDLHLGTRFRSALLPPDPYIRWVRGGGGQSVNTAHFPPSSAEVKYM